MTQAQKVINAICGLLALLVLIALPFVAMCQPTPIEGKADSTVRSNVSFEPNISVSNTWLLNGVAYGVNEPNLSLNVQYNNPNFYAYAYKANSLVQQVSDGNYAMLGIGHKAAFNKTFVDISAVSMFMQYQRFYEGYRNSETQIFVAAFVTQELVKDKHYINVQPAYVFFPGYEKELRKETNNFLVRADYEYRNVNLGTFNLLYYFSNGVQATSVGSAVGFNYLKRFPLTNKLTGKVLVTGIRNVKRRDTTYFKDVLSVGYSLEF